MAVRAETAPMKAAAPDTERSMMNLLVVLMME